MHICALEVPNEYALEVYTQVDDVREEMLEPCLGAFYKVEWQVLNDEEVIIRPACSTGEVEVFLPHDRVGVPRVLDDVRQCVEMR